MLIAILCACAFLSGVCTTVFLCAAIVGARSECER